MRGNDLSITRTEMKKALFRSGYLIENKAHKILGEKGYDVYPNQIFKDDKTQVTREMDVLANKDISVNKNTRMKIVLIIECINNEQPIAFITNNVNTKNNHGRYLHCTGKPLAVKMKADDLLPTPIQGILKVEEYHHYYTGQLANQYCSFQKNKGNKGEWIAKHEDAHYKLFEKIMQEVEYYSVKNKINWIERLFGRIHLCFYYPILITGGEIVEVTPFKPRMPIKRANWAMYTAKTFIGEKEESYVIDAVKISGLGMYLDMIDGEMNSLSIALQENEKILLSAAASS